MPVTRELDHHQSETESSSSNHQGSTKVEIVGNVIIEVFFIKKSVVGPFQCNLDNLLVFFCVLVVHLNYRYSSKGNLSTAHSQNLVLYNTMK